MKSHGFKPGTQVEVDTEPLWHFTFDVPQGKIVAPDILPEYYVVKMKKPVVYGGEYKLDEVTIHQSHLREVIKRQVKGKT